MFSEPQVTMSSNSPAQFVDGVGACETKVVAVVTTFGASSTPVPPVVAAFLPNEKITNGALVVRFDGVQPAGTLLIVVVTTVSKLTAALGSDKQPIVASLMPLVRVSGLVIVKVQAAGVPAAISSPRTA